jgi:hypothetical protein
MLDTQRVYSAYNSMFTIMVFEIRLGYMVVDM